MIILSLLVPINVKAQEKEIKISYQTNQGQIIYNSTGIPAEKAWEEYQAKQVVQTKPRVAKKNNGSYYQRQCVYYIKQITGVWTTYGDGGKKLSANSGPKVGVAIIFRGTHIGWITGYDGSTITYTDRNSDYRGTTRYGVKIASNSPAIWKYHKF